jgi:predicted Zn-dependent peptidase
VGEFDAAAVSAAVTKSFGPWKGSSENVTDTPASPAAPASRRLLIAPRAGSVQSQIVVGRVAATVTDPDYYPLLVANTIYSDAFGSRLVENIREDKGYTYSPDGSIATRTKGGLVTATADVRTEVTARRSPRSSTSRTGSARLCRPTRSCSAPSATRAGSTCSATRSRRPSPIRSPRTG